MSNHIERHIKLKVPIEKVWRALTDPNEFGEWFRVKLNNPFSLGKVTSGYITYPGYEHLKWEVVVQKIEPMRLFSFNWHPYAVNPDIDYSLEKKTLVEFKLQEVPGGTQLTIFESGFDGIPSYRHAEAFLMNENGWNIQIENINKYLTSKL